MAAPSNSAPARGRTRWWLAWIGANAAGEALGLGLVFAGGFFMFRTWGEPRSAPAVLALAALTVLLGVVEGSVVGFLQWRVLRSLLPAVGHLGWVGATVLGAVAAWLLGMIPSTVSSFTSEEASAPPPEPSMFLVLTLAAGLGIAGGLILALPQWRVLRRSTPRSGLWLPANAAAWAIGMPWIFWLVGATVGETQTAGSFLLFVCGLGMAGAIVGAVHGWVLLRWIVAPRQSARSTP